MHKHGFGSFLKSRYWSFACASTSDILNLFEYFSILEPSLTHSVCFGCILVVHVHTRRDDRSRSGSQAGCGVCQGSCNAIHSQLLAHHCCLDLTRMFQDRGERTMKDAWNVKMKIKNM